PIGIAAIGYPCSSRLERLQQMYMRLLFAIFKCCTVLPALFMPGLSYAQTAKSSQAAESQVTAADHWAFQPPRLPSVPCPRNNSWCRTPVDAFLVEQQEKAGIQPSPTADACTLLRRLTFDLTGLPPSPEQICSFLHDTGTDAYERLVDRLL